MKKTRRLVLTGLFAALICAATYIHIPVGSGYIHPADGVLLAGAWLLGPLYGGIAAGIGSALADIFAGFVFYAPATLVIKGLMAVCAALLFKKLKTNFRTLICSIVAEFIMIGGYFIFELIFYREYAIFNVLANIIQGVAGIIISVVLYMLLSRSNATRSLLK